VWSYTSTPPVRLHGVVLSSAEGQLYLFTVKLYGNIHVGSYCPNKIPTFHEVQIEVYRNSQRKKVHRKRYLYMV
jgi:hypothetical protein